jgi:hypothetical protein
MMAVLQENASVRTRMKGMRLISTVRTSERASHDLTSIRDYLFHPFDPRSIQPVALRGRLEVKSLPLRFAGWRMLPGSAL